MNLLSGIKNALKKACYIFCALTVLYSLIMLGVYDKDANMSVFTVLLFYPLGFVFSLCNIWLASRKWNEFTKSLIRYVILLADIAVFIGIPQAESLSGSSSVILFALVTVLYAVASVLLLRIQSARKKQQDKKAEYQSVYNEVKRK